MLTTPRFAHSNDASEWQVLAGENLVLTIQRFWRWMQAKVNSKASATVIKQDGFDEDSELEKAIEMTFVHLTTLILRVNLPFNEDSVNAGQ